METLKIMERESQNQNSIYLYPSGEKHWDCYGESALLLRRLYPHFICRNKIFEEVEVFLPHTRLNDLDFKALTIRFGSYVNNDGSVAIETKPNLRNDEL